MANEANPANPANSRTAIDELFGEFDQFDDFQSVLADPATRDRLRSVAGQVENAVTDDPAYLAVPPSELRVRVLQAVRGEASGLGIGSRGQSTILAPPASSARTSHGSSGHPQPKVAIRWRRRVLMGVAALRAAVAAVVTALPFGSQPVVALSIKLAPPLDSPSPAAVGQADFLATKKGSAVKVDLDGLKPNGPTEFYECWLVGTGDSPSSPRRISIGTFTTTTGKATFNWPTTAYDRSYSRVDISLEPNDGDPGFSGVRVLDTAATPTAYYP
jgi:Anti-sigma-K factor rskA